ncbi:hypothetical protein [Paenibacillus silviterrae]|uniref:hypothetical protein n=1 Tax=Paenibacillus silviterrae TaxID=3242194 RepID=UPI0025434143|nr:hypothetical protein [Paenibacillus chinjuensis]
MPYVLRHTQSGQIATGILRNGYNLDYYGTKWWDDEEEADAEREAFLSSVGVTDVPFWHILKVDENRLKIFNVKLKNDPSRRLFMDKEGVVTVTTNG